ncbi:MAG: radical SAM protein [Deltaproteobacteria bacterium]|nr:radical SAM protein [Deltaproteobacteria bacterium]
MSDYFKILREGKYYFRKVFQQNKTTRVRYIGSPLENAELARSEYENGKTVLESLPPVVTFALTTFCNNKIPCLICDRNTRAKASDSETRGMVIEAVRPLLQTAKIVLLHCGGEAMLSRHFDEVIRSINPPTRVAFATNAMLLTNKRADLMLEKDIMSKFVVSLDASTPEAYHFMRPSSDFDTVVSNIEYYTSKARKLKREASGVSLNMTVCEANLKDVPTLVDLAVRVGATEVDYNHLNGGLDHRVKTVDGWEWDYKEQAKFKDKKFHDEMVLEAYKRAKQHGINMTFVGKPFLGPDADKNKAIVEELCGRVAFQTNPWSSKKHKVFAPGVPPCFKPWQETVIQPSGNVRICYFHEELRHKAGNILTTDFMELWNSDLMVKQREEFLAHAVSGICKKSQPCMHRHRQ